MAEAEGGGLRDGDKGRRGGGWPMVGDMKVRARERG